MSNSSPKISFDLPVQPAPKADPAPRPQEQIDDATETSSFYMPLPPVFSTARAEPDPEEDLLDLDTSQSKVDVPQSKGQPVDEPKLQGTSEPKPFRRPTPKPPAFAATGLMDRRESSFLKRNAAAIGLGSGIVLTFLLGLMTAYFFFGDREEQQFSQSVTPNGAFAPETATRSIVPDMTNVAAGVLSAETQSALAQSVLAGLTPESQLAAQRAFGQTSIEGHTLLNSIKLRQLREGVLGGVYNVAVEEENGVSRVQFETININMSAGYEEDLLIEAAQNGLLELSGALRTAEGGLDKKTMIFDVVQRSLLADETTESTDAALAMSRKVFAASIARTQNINGERVYTIQPGDSLAYIAMQFFGMPGEYRRILEANPDTLQSPDKIQIGQRIVIPG